MTLISRSRHWMVLDHRTQIVNEQSALSTKESLVKCLSASNLFCKQVGLTKQAEKPNKACRPKNNVISVTHFQHLLNT